VAEVFEVNTERVIHETLNGEVIAIDLASGTYYSMRGTAQAIWEGVVAGSSVETIVNGVARAFDVDGPDPRDQIVAFLEDLRDKDLVVRSELVASGDAHPSVEAGSGRARPVYEAPRLETFDDMQDLILLDPIHDVDPGTGWPRPIDEQQSDG
jgi:hypothetical protein